MTLQPVRPWLENDSLFREELEGGHRYAAQVLERLHASGVDGWQTPMGWRPTFEERGAYADVDLEVEIGTRVEPLEVKSRRLAFTDDPASYPARFETVFVDTVGTWDRKPVKARAIIFVSRETGGMLVLPVRRTIHLWTKRLTPDGLRNTQAWRYECPRSELVAFSVLTDWIRGL